MLRLRPASRNWSRSSLGCLALLAIRAALVLVCQGIPNHAIAQQTGLSRPTVIATRKGFLAGGLEALRQRPKRKRLRSVLTRELEQKILEITLKTRPAVPNAVANGHRRAGKWLRGGGFEPPTFGL